VTGVCPGICRYRQRLLYHWRTKAGS